MKEPVLLPSSGVHADRPAILRCAPRAPPAPCAAQRAEAPTLPVPHLCASFPAPLAGTCSPTRPTRSTARRSRPRCSCPRPSCLPRSRSGGRSGSRSRARARTAERRQWPSTASRARARRTPPSRQRAAVHTACRGSGRARPADRAGRARCPPPAPLWAGCAGRWPRCTRGVGQGPACCRRLAGCCAPCQLYTMPSAAHLRRAWPRRCVRRCAAVPTGSICTTIICNVRRSRGLYIFGRCLTSASQVGGPLRRWPLLSAHGSPGRHQYTYMAVGYVYCVDADEDSADDD